MATPSAAPRGVAPADAKAKARQSCRIISVPREIRLTDYTHAMPSLIGNEAISHSRRRLSLFDCVCIGINGIVGSGIYLLIAPLAALAGYASVVGILTCGVLCILVGLCFAELSGMFDRSGGPHVYARTAFGRYFRFLVGSPPRSPGLP